MATYLISAEKTITRQEGDDADIVMIIPAEFDMTDATVMFQVFSGGVAFIEKTPTPVLQVITVTLDAVDTKGYKGTKRWELQVTKAGKITTLGKGDFVIVKELIV